MIRTTGWLVCTALLLVGLAGCGKEQQAPETPSTAPTGGVSSSAQVTTADLDKVVRSNKPFKLVLIVKTRNNPFFDPMIKAAEAEAKALGVELQVQAPEQETYKEKQFALVQQMITSGVDAILISPADSKGIVPALRQAQDKKILVINLDNRVDADTARIAGVKLSGYVGADNEEGGKLAGQAMVSVLPPNASVAIIEGIRGANNAEARKTGFETAVKGKLVIDARESADWDMNEANQKAQSILVAHPQLKGIFCANDMMAIGAIKAVLQSGKKGQISIIGYDNIPAVQAYLKTGELNATIEQHPDQMGKYGVRMAVGVLTKTLKTGGECMVQLDVMKK